MKQLVYILIILALRFLPLAAAFTNASQEEGQFAQVAADEIGGTEDEVDEGLAQEILLSRGKETEIVFIFMTYRGVNSPTLWQRWYEDGIIRLSQAGVESFDPGVSEVNAKDVWDTKKWTEETWNRLRHDYKPQKIRSIVSFDCQWLKNDTVANVPFWLKDSIWNNPQNEKGQFELVAQWGDTNRVVRKLLNNSLERFPSATFFSVISDSTIPMKRMDEIYDEVQKDGRSRIDLGDSITPPRGPRKGEILSLPRSKQGVIMKHWSWLNVAREHAEVLVEEGDQWSGKNWSWSLDHHGSFLQGDAAGSDEFWPCAALQRRIGAVQFLASTIFQGWKGSYNIMWGVTQLILTEASAGRIDFNSAGVDTAEVEELMAAAAAEKSESGEFDRTRLSRILGKSLLHKSLGRLLQMTWFRDPWGDNGPFVKDPRNTVTNARLWLKKMDTLPYDISNASDPFDILKMFTYASWRGYEPLSLGSGWPGGTAHPMYFSTLNAVGLDFLRVRVGPWYFRKVARNARVEKCDVEPTREQIIGSHREAVERFWRPETTTLSESENLERVRLILGHEPSKRLFAGAERPEDDDDARIDKTDPCWLDNFMTNLLDLRSRRLIVKTNPAEFVLYGGPKLQEKNLQQPNSLTSAKTSAPPDDNKD